MQITGHKTYKKILDYIKTSYTEHAQKLKELWSKSDGKMFKFHFHSRYMRKCLTS